MSLLLALQVAGGPVSYADSLSVGSYSISGKTISDSVVRADSLAKGTYTQTGIAISDKVVRSDSLSVVSYTVSGKSLTDSVVRGDSLANGVYTITGKTVSDSVVRSDLLSKGSYVVTGFNVNDVITTAGGTSYADLLSVGNYSLTGNNLNDELIQVNKAGGYDNKKPKKRYIVKVGERLLVFKDKATALQALPTDEVEAELITKQAIEKAKGIDSQLTFEADKSYDYQAVLEKVKNEAELQKYLQNQNYYAILELYEQALTDEEDIEILLMGM